MTGGAKPRIEYIDLAKGFCILFVVLWHCMQFIQYPEVQANKIMMTFRMPLYFVLSGLFFKEYDGFIDFARRKVNKLIVPFAFFYIISCIIVPTITGLLLSDFSFKHTMGMFLFWITEHYDNQAIWFLMCLFNVNIIFYVIILLSKKIKHVVPTIVILSLLSGSIGVALSFLKINLWLFVDSAYTCAPYFCFGYLLRKYSNILYPNKYDSCNWFFVIISFVVVAIASSSLGAIGYQANVIPAHPELVYACGMIGTVGILLLSKIVKKVPGLNYIGRYSIMILLTHYTIAKYLNIFIISKMNLNINATLVILFLCTLFICITMIPIFRKYLPKFTAQEDLF